MSLHGERNRRLDDADVVSLVDRYRRATSPAEQREVADALRAQGVVLRPGVDGDDVVH
jgi:hypothetical protein